MIEARSFTSLGTGVTVLSTTPSTVDEAAAAVTRVLEGIDSACSRFRQDSELSALNRAGHDGMVVSPLLLRALLAAMRACRLTEGAVDPTVGTAMQRIGYDQDFRALRDDGVLRLRIEPARGCDAVSIDPKSRMVRLAADVQIDLGASAKALAADLAARAAHEATRCGVLVSLGGDIAIAGQGPADGWPILIAEDHSAPLDGDGEVIALRAGAVATSSTTVRRWQQAGITRHHIVDPRTGSPTDGPWRTASVVATTCVDANAAATAAIVKGEAGMAWLQRQGLAARLVGRNGEVARTSNWPASQEAGA